MLMPLLLLLRLTIDDIVGTCRPSPLLLYPTPINTTITTTTTRLQSISRTPTSRGEYPYSSRSPVPSTCDRFRHLRQPCGLQQARSCIRLIQPLNSPPPSNSRRCVRKRSNLVILRPGSSPQSPPRPWLALLVGLYRHGLKHFTARSSCRHTIPRQNHGLITFAIVSLASCYHTLASSFTLSFESACKTFFIRAGKYPPFRNYKSQTSPVTSTVPGSTSSLFRPRPFSILAEPHRATVLFDPLPHPLTLTTPIYL